MNIIAVDDEKLALSSLEKAICEALPGVTPICFGRPEDALGYAKLNDIDIAFLDVQMSGMDGLALAAELKAIKPTINIIFVTGYTEYLEDAFDLYASGFVRKPVRPRRVQREINNLRFPLKEKASTEQIKAIGPYTFDHGARRVYYHMRDTSLTLKEYQLFSLLASNPGTIFTFEELFSKIWSDDPVGNAENTVRVHISSLRKKLEMSETGDITIKNKRHQGYYLELDS